MSTKIINPSTEETLLEYESDSDEQLESKLEAASRARASLTALPISKRAELMVRAAELMEHDAEELALNITREMGKPLKQAMAEIAKSVHAMRFYAEHAEEFLQPFVLNDPQRVGANSAASVYEPMGVVLAVMPWNYPVWQVIRFAAPALMAGNVGLLKHASNIHHAAQYLGELFTRAGFPQASFQTLFLESRRVAGVIADPRVHAVTLTGSEPAGRSVAETAGRHLKKVVLELGGSDPFVVMPSADLDKAADIAILSRINNNGQACIAAKRFIVHEGVYEQFKAALAERVESLRIGSPEEDVQLGPLATASGKTDLQELEADALAQGAAVAARSREVPEKGWYYPLTILENVTESARIFSEEAFGPLAAIHSVNSLEEAIELANATDFGLSSAIFTTSDEDVEAFSRGVEAGMVFVNGMTASYPELPFGGVKNSGVGRELSREGMLEFCNMKTIWKAS